MDYLLFECIDMSSGAWNGHRREGQEPAESMSSVGLTAIGAKNAQAVDRDQYRPFNG